MNNIETYWPLMKDCITQEDKNEMLQFISTSGRFTNGPHVKEFEQQWSDWLGVKHSLFVSSGSTANFLLLAALKELYKLKDGDKVIVPAITWVTNVSPVIQLGLKPVFCDVDKRTFSFDKEALSKIAKEHDDIKACFVSHLFGVPAEIEDYKCIFEDAGYDYEYVKWIEDVCESHGAVCDGQMGIANAGTLSEGSTFSFYFGHHMTTVEGGMVSTNNEELYQIMRAKRSHGMARELDKKYYEQAMEKHPNIHPMFLFITDGYNFRNSEIYAVLGKSQLKRLNDSNAQRRKNYTRFLEIISEYRDYVHSDLIEDGVSSFCLQFICKTETIRDKLEKYLQESGVETRPLCSGNLLRQPFLAGNGYKPEDFPNAEYLHKHGFFIGNNHLITDEDFNRLHSDIDRACKRMSE